ncbi:MAG TPA: DNA alkylation repair protein [Opitutus sp.]|nr:DNA alkylation repair protein [Opitutus sp.]
MKTPIKASRSPDAVGSDSASTAHIIAKLRSMRSERNIAGMRRFGIVAQGEQLGISIQQLRLLGRPHRRNHALALELWESGIHEARLLATVIEDPAQITKAQMERWVRDCDNWSVTDALAFVFDRTEFAEAMAERWSRRKAEYVKRAAFSIMAGMAVHRKELPDEIFLRFLTLIEREATDERNFVRKAVNWALRGIGKRNASLRRAAMTTAKRIAGIDSRAARWIASDALRELRSRA